MSELIACTVKLAFSIGNLRYVYIIFDKNIVRGGDIKPGRYTIVVVIGNDCEHIRGYHRVTNEKDAMKILCTYAKAFGIEEINASDGDSHKIVELLAEHRVKIVVTRIGNIAM